MQNQKHIIIESGALWFATIKERNKGQDALMKSYANG